MSEDSSGVDAPLDAEQVRRHSLRVSRWQALGALVALVLAVTFFVLPLLVLDPGESDGPTKRGRAAAPEPTGEPRTTWDTTVDAAFPLDLGLPAPARGPRATPSEDAPGADLAGWSLCGTSGFADDVVDRLAVRSGDDARELVTLADEDAAGALLDRVSEAADACTAWTVAERDLGDEALDLAGAGEVRQLVRVGNAVLVLEHGRVPGSRADAEVALDQVAVVGDVLADRLCGYALRPC